VSEAELHSLLETARRAALKAGPAILDIYNAADAPAARRKADASPVTVADEIAEKLIVATLSEGGSGIPAVAEELCERDGMPPEAPQRFWLVDPLDGTKEFLSRNGEFTVNIALIVDRRPVLGVVHVPALGTTYSGCGPGTARRQHGTAPSVAIAARPVPERGAVVVHSRSHESKAELARFLASLDAPTTRVSGSAVKFCLIAAGEADLYPRFGPTMEWDTAAGQAVLEAAGGSVTSLEGAPFGYGKTGFLNGGFIARGR